MAAAVVLPLYAWKVYLKQDYTDFQVYYHAALHAKSGDWSGIYDLRAGASPFRYAPPLLFLFQLFAFSSPLLARLSWYFFQYSCYALGFYVLWKSISSLREGRRGNPAFYIALSFLFIFRFCLDSFTIGQISGLLFLGYSAGLWGYVFRKSFSHALGIFLPALTKIGPGFSFFPFLFEKRRDFRKKTLLTLLFLGSCVFLGSFLLTQEFASGLFLWKQWIGVVSLDSKYFDSSHYGSQCLNSFLLRWASRGGLSDAGARQIRLIASLAVVFGTLLFWVLRRPKKLMGRWLFFTISIYPYLLLMPQTFKYSMTVLALPVLGLLALQKKMIWTWFALSTGVLCLSLPGKDIVGDFLFFGIQRASLPFFSIVFLMIAHALESYRLSTPSQWARMREYFFPSPLLPPLNSFNLPSSSHSLLIPLPLCRDLSLEINEQKAWLSSWSKLPQFAQCEVLVIPYGEFQSLEHPFLKHWRALQAEFPHLRILPLDGQRNEKSQSLQEGVYQAKGEVLFILNLEQRVDPEFFLRANASVEEGLHLVRANRRLHETRFRVPVRLLSLTRRHFEMGRSFNRLMRFFLPLHTVDTQSGTYAMRRDFAIFAFSSLRIRNFLFELEIALLASLSGFRAKDLPAIFSIPFEKGSRRIFLETLQTLFWLPALIRRVRLGCYDAPALPHSCQITADDWGMSPGINEGILELAQAGLVRRVSILATGNHLETRLKELTQVPGIELGLHLNLTLPPFSDRRGGSPAIQSPFSFLLRWFNPFQHARLEEFALYETKKQIQTLEALGIKIQYLDGHHHVHLVPGLMDALMPIAQSHQIRRIRLPLSWGLIWGSKFPLILLSLAAKRRFKRLGFEFLPCFYPKLSLFSDPKLLCAQLSRRPGAEVIVHPAKKDDLGAECVADPYRSQRVVEFRGLRVLKSISYG